MKAWLSEQHPELLHKDKIKPTKTVSVWLENSNKRQKKNFRCMNCGLIVFQYYDDVRVIMVGGTPTIENPTKVYSHPFEVMCKRCKQMYRVE